MNLIRVCIFDYDRQYTEVLAKIISLRCEDMEVSLYPGKETLEEFHVLMINERERDCIDPKLFPRCLFFTDEPTAATWETFYETEPGECFLYKYESVAKIVTAIRLFYGSRVGSKNPLLTIHDPPVLVGVFSGAGGVGCTSAAVSVGRFLASEYKERTLFLSFEDMDSSRIYFPMEEGMPSIEDYLYYFFSKQSSCVHELSSFLYTDFSGLQTVYSSGGENPLCRLDVDALYQLLSRIAATEAYAYIVMDLSTVFAKQQAYLLQCCDYMVLWGMEDRRCEEKNHAKLQQLRETFHIDTETVLKKIGALDNGGIDQELVGKENFFRNRNRKEVRELAETIRGERQREPQIGTGDYRSSPIGDQC